VTGQKWVIAVDPKAWWGSGSNQLPNDTGGKHPCGQTIRPGNQDDNTLPSHGLGQEGNQSPNRSVNRRPGKMVRKIRNRPFFLGILGAGSATDQTAATSSLRKLCVRPGLWSEMWTKTQTSQRKRQPGPERGDPVVFITPYKGKPGLKALTKLSKKGPLGGTHILPNSRELV